MVDERECPSAAADRLERALERIARLKATLPVCQTEDAEKSNAQESLTRDVARQLDALIDRLRTNVSQQKI